MDVLDHQSLVDGVAAVVEHFGGIDVLVNNGIYQGTGTMVPFLDVDFSDMRKIFEGNVFGQLVLVREVLPQMIERGGGTIMNMISATAYRDPPGKIGQGGWGMVYAMSKAAFARVAPLLEVEHGDQGIRAFSVDPGYVVTETAEARGTGGAVRRALRRRHSAGHRRRDRLARNQPRSRRPARADRHRPARDQAPRAAARLAAGRLGQPGEEGQTRLTLRKFQGVIELQADCSRCFALCCVAPGFAKSADFGYTKPAGKPCRNLLDDFRCAIHSTLRRQGFSGCRSTTASVPDST